MKHWQRKFDTKLDVDLLDEKELYDPNTIGSMLKTWLRDLPEDIISKPQQAALAEELAKDNPDYTRMGQPAPQKLRDALSDLPPFNYYLLFAITCHLSLLLSHTDKNKMDLNNLAICIGPPLKLERWLFNYLVGDWRHCWQGCFTEKQYLEAEKAHEQGKESSASESRQPQEKKPVHDSTNAVGDERAVYSSGSGEASRQGSGYEDARSPPQSPHRKPENLKPSGSPSYTNGGFPSADHNQLSTKASQDLRRPSTAGEKKTTDDTTVKAGPKSPRAHSRSQSDLPLTPIKSTSSPALPVLPFQLRES